MEILNKNKKDSQKKKDEDPNSIQVKNDDYKTVDVDYKYDLQSFFNYFNWINISKFAKAAGINESKMRQYKTGQAFASERTKATIEKTIHKMSQELASVEL